MEGEENNWSETVEDLVHEGDIDKAISLLESLVSKLETATNSSQLLLSSALFDLAKLYSSQGFSLKADDTHSRALLIKQRSHHTPSPNGELKAAKRDTQENWISRNECSPSNGSSEEGDHGKSSNLDDGALHQDGCLDDGRKCYWAARKLALFSQLGRGCVETKNMCLVVVVCGKCGVARMKWASKEFILPQNYVNGDFNVVEDWEAVADHAPDELLPQQCLPGVSKLSLEDTKVQTPKRRGRGTFAYRKHGLYSDQQSDRPVTDDSEDEAACPTSEGDEERKNLNYGTSHVLVLADFPSNTRTTDLQKLLESFKDRGVVIRWVNEKAALAVFRTPSIDNDRDMLLIRVRVHVMLMWKC
ncbi:unnamed protein product [Ilex paraguariensis]|uniref:Coiled-coil domain-containing protein R3HCC1L n=1 Tax=Ilex paraguariensis TaxID=185542 RepID=A0ABC8UUB0_9AQUA